jgi:hypothetical protein
LFQTKQISKKTKIDTLLKKQQTKKESDRGRYVYRNEGKERENKIENEQTHVLTL